MSDYPYFPLFVDLSGKRIVVIGAGKVAARRIKALLTFTETVTVVAEAFDPSLMPLAEEKRIEIHKKPYEASDIEGAFFVLAATDRKEVNLAVRQDCKRLGIPVNVSSDRELCDFYFPGIARKDDLVVGITASGRDHRGVKEAVKKLQEYLDSAT